MHSDNGNVARSRGDNNNVDYANVIHGDDNNPQNS